ncbi:MAG: hypothetical protein ABJA85_08155, partial [Bacteroidota bacterium]
KEQVNNGHLIELLSATAIVDFINKPDSELITPQWFEFGAEDKGSPFTIAHFSTETKERCIKPLTKFAYASKIATDFIPALKKETFYGPKELNIAGSLGVPNEYQVLLGFFKEFQKWSAVEMNSPDNGRSFSSFNFDASDHLNTLIHGKTIAAGFFIDSSLSRKNVSTVLNKIEVGEPRDLPVPEKYLTMLYKTAAESLKIFGQLP